MSNKITVTKTDAGFSISFPFALKDQFKAAFPSAKWDRFARVWTVGPRSGKRLDQWAATVQGSGVIEALDEQEAVDLQERELADLERELAAVRDAIAETAARTRQADDLAVKMDAARQALQAAEMDLSKARREAKAAEAEAAAEMAKVEALVSGVIDMPQVLAAQRTMIRLHGRVGREAKQDYRAAQREIRAEHDKLKAAGFRSEGLAYLGSINDNRPDRDDPRRIGRTEILTITPYEPEE